jgi:hypothetical protein
MALLESVKRGTEILKMPHVANDSEPYNDVDVFPNQTYTFIQVALSERTVGAQGSVFDSRRHQNCST